MIHGPSPIRNASKNSLLVLRDRLTRVVREYFYEQEFVEIDAPLLVPSPGTEVHLKAFPVTESRWLITSPEYQMKRLLAGGMERIFAIAKCFRDGEEGPMHNPEFTMSEWYRVGEGLDALQDDVKELIRRCAHEVSGHGRISIGDAVIDVDGPWDSFTVCEVMEEHAGISMSGDETNEELLELVLSVGVDVGTAKEWDDIFFCAFLDKVEPKLAANPRPFFLEQWPRPLAALSKLDPTNSAVAMRFEAYVGPVELANAFLELTDASEQRQRCNQDNEKRRRLGLPEYPLDEKFLEALARMPESVGIALGLDRLFALVLGADVPDIVSFSTSEL